MLFLGIAINVLWGQLKSPCKTGEVEKFLPKGVYVVVAMGMLFYNFNTKFQFHDLLVKSGKCRIFFFFFKV